MIEPLQSEVIDFDTQDTYNQNNTGKDANGFDLGMIMSQKEVYFFMSLLANNYVWQDRLETIETKVKEIQIPELFKENKNIPQDKEWFNVKVDGEIKKLRCHDYGKIYEIPGLYEKLFYEKLQCCSPSVVVNLLKEITSDFGKQTNDFKVLDIGAGNGMVGDELDNIGVDSVTGIDILPEAKAAAHRDRADVYKEYLVTDLTSMPKNHEIKLEANDFNCLTTVAALGFGDIPPFAILRALAFIETPGWLAFNIKEDFLHEDDTSGFCRLVRHLNREKYMQIQCYRRYQHRISIAGEPLYYVAMVAKKLKPIPPGMLDKWKN